MKDRDKDNVIPIARELIKLGFTIIATGGTAKILEKARVTVTRVNKVFEGQPHIVDAMINEQVQMIVNTTGQNAQSLADSFSIRRTALMQGIPLYTTMAGAKAALAAISAQQTGST